MSEWLIFFVVNIASNALAFAAGMWWGSRVVHLLYERALKELRNKYL